MVTFPDDHMTGTPIDTYEFDGSETFGGFYIAHYFKCDNCGTTFWRGREKVPGFNYGRARTPYERQLERLFYLATERLTPGDKVELRKVVENEYATRNVE